MNIYFDNKGELAVWGIVLCLVMWIPFLVEKIYGEFIPLSVLPIFVWIFLGKYGSKIIINFFYRNDISLKNKVSSLGDLIFVIKYKLQKFFSKNKTL